MNSWLNNGGITEYLIDCNRQTIHISGNGIYKVKTSALNLLLNGLINIINSDFECNMSKIYASGVASSVVQLINLQGTGIHSIIDTNFEFCGIYSAGIDSSTNWDPSLIYISGESTNSFSSVKFNNPDTNNPDPYEICQTRPIRIEGNCSLEIDNSDFYNSSCYTKGSFLWLSATKNITILDCKFQECESLINQAHAIFIFEEDKQTITIDNCNFLDCGKNNQGYLIQCEISEFIFSNCNIVFSNSNGSGGIKIDSQCSATILNIIFNNFRQPTALYYDPIDQISSEFETTVSGCIFTGFKINGISTSGTQYLAFCFGENLNTFFYNNTIENYEFSTNYFPNLFIGKISNKIDNCRFVNNVFNGLYSGGTGIELVGDNVQLINCYFSNNTAVSNDNTQGGSGGAIHFTGSSIEIGNCMFINNKSDFEGGALSIECITSYIHNTTFINNKAAQSTASGINDNRKMGGAIYFNHKNNAGEDSYIVSNCTLRSNTGNENGHALFVAGTLTKVVVSDFCVFEDNSRNNVGSQILANENSSIEVSNSTFCISDSKKSKSRGIELLDGKLHVHHSTQNSLIEGNAILISRFKNEAIIEDNQFIDCYFSNQLSFIVTFNGNSFDFFRNVFDFPLNNGCGCLRMYTSGNVNVHENTFKNAVFPSDYRGIFIYEETEVTSDENQNIINSNIFDSITSQFTTCFTFKWITTNFEFHNNTLKNNDSIDRQGEFNFMGKLNNGKFYFGANNLINNTSRGVFGGGAGLLFKNSKDNNYLYENHFTIIFDGSTFISNHEVEYASNRKFRNGNGGAIQIGWTEETSNVDVEILNSNFSNNYSDRQGGAVNLQIIGYILINNCTFDENIAGQKTTDPIRILGGAIYIICDFIWGDGHYPSSNGGKWRYSDSIKIIGSKFNKNLAFDGLSIFIESSEYTSYFVTDCHFIDNHNHEYTNYSIIYQTKEFIFENSTIEFTDITKSSSAIEIIRPTKIIGSHFIKNCVQNGNIAEALLIETEANEIEISNSTFEDCGKGGDIYTSVKINTAIANIYNNTFNFTTNKQENSCQPISVLVYCNLIFSGNRISNSYCNGGLQYKPASIGDVSKENLLIEKCTFENCQGTNTRALNIKLFTTRLIFSNNTFQDCSATGITTSGGYLLGLDLSSTTIT